MVVESGLIPLDNNPLPFSLADNVRRDKNNQVVGTGYYAVWCELKAERTDTAFTNQVKTTVKVPIAHGEGRFTTTDSTAQAALKGGSLVAFRYCGVDGQVDASSGTIL